MAISFAKRKFTASTGGRGITLGTGSTTIHDPLTGTIATGDFDEVWMWASNIDTVPIEVTVEFGGTTAAGDNIILTIPPKSGLVQLVPGFLISGNNNVTAKAGTASKINVFGFVNLIVES